jgi:hypothetical protein
MKYILNQFKSEILNNLNYDNSYDDGDYSHVYIIMH